MFFVAFFATVAVYAQVKVGNNLVKGVVDTTQEVQNISLKVRTKVPSKALVFDLGYGFPSINNALVKQDFWSKKLGSKIDFAVDFRMQFQKKDIEDEEVVQVPSWVAMGVGVGFSYIHQSAGFDAFSETLTDYIDIDGMKCNVSFNYKNVKESVSLTYLDIPLYFEIGRPSRVKTTAYVKLGFKASFLVGKNFSGEGTYTSSGYYPQWDVNLDDVDVLGYYKDDQLCYNIIGGKLNPFVLWGGLSAGVNIPFSSLEKNKLAKWMLRISAKADYSLTPISKPLPDAIFNVVKDVNSSFRLNQANMLDKSRIFSYGLSLSLIYCL
jgi:hypothetical protein